MCSEALPMDSPSPVELPVGWREVPLRAVADTKFSNVDKLTKSGEQAVRLCNYVDVYNNDYITEAIEFMEATASQPEIDRFHLQVGDVIITKDSETPYDIGTPARVDYATDDLVCGYHLALLRPDQDAVDSDYLSKQIGHSRLAGYFARMANGLTRYGLSVGAISSAPVWLPPLNEQRQIGRALREIDTAIEQAEALIAKLKQVRAGLLHDLLIRGINDNGEIRDPIAHPEQFQNSPLGLIPCGWTIETLVSRIALPQGQVDPRLAPYCDWILVAPDHVESVTGRLLASVTAAEQGAISGKYVFGPGDVIYSKIRPYLRKAVLASGEGLCSADMYPLRPNDGVHPRFLLAVILGEPFSRFASAVSMRSGFPKINREELAEFVTSWPPFDQQQRIASAIELCDREQDAIENELTKLHLLKSGLMADLLSGRVRVPAGLEVA